MTEESAARPPRLVFGDDGSPGADTGWQWVVDQPWTGWLVDVLTADADADAADIEWGKAAEAAEWTPPWTRAPESLEGTEDVRFLTVATDPRTMLAEVDADLLVVGLRTGSQLEAALSGSTTEWLLHHPPAPLIVARTAAAAERVTICADESAHAIAALDSFARLPLATTSHVTVLSVDDGRTDAEAAVAEATSALEGAVASIDSLVVAGEPSEAILDHLRSDPPDLVVLGTRGLTGWQRLRLGSTAAEVVRGAPCTGLVDFAEKESEDEG